MQLRRQWKMQLMMYKKHGYIPMINCICQRWLMLMLIVWSNCKKLICKPRQQLMKLNNWMKLRKQQKRLLILLKMQQKLKDKIQKKELQSLRLKKKQLRKKQLRKKHPLRKLLRYKILELVMRNLQWKRFQWKNLLKKRLMKRNKLLKMKNQHKWKRIPKNLKATLLLRTVQNQTINKPLIKDLLHQMNKYKFN